ncbi:hypothetical protein HIM_03275 [Hirsutella minnesotensis 3608]|nr:hypothetical protein HIM_03275 [Hirsutella minnesotensis 3608]
MSVVLLLSGLFSYAASYHSFPSSHKNGQFTTRQKQAGDGAGQVTPSNEALLKGSSSHLPHRPMRFSLPALVLFIVLRLETFHHVNHRKRCASPGIESFLCVLLIAYDIVSSRSRWGIPPVENADDPWRSFLDDLYDWFTGPRVTMVTMLTSACVFSLGTKLATGSFMESTYVCFSPVDSCFLTFLVQLVGLFLDATIIVLLWRVLAWTRTSQSRLCILASVFALASLASGCLWLIGVLLGGSHPSNPGFGSLQSFDFLVDSMALATLASSMAFWICETSPITPTSVLTFVTGLWEASVNVLHLGDWIHSSRIDSLLPVCLLLFGTVLFIYTHDVRFIIFLRRSFLTFMLMVVLCAATIMSFTTQIDTFEDRHPISELMYHAQIRHNRWLLTAGTSQSLPVAVRVYEERHAGRAPPPNFAEWYKNASGSPVIDSFEQIDRDLEPFWSLSPAELRKRAVLTAADPSAAVIKIQNGEVARSDSANTADQQDLDEMVEMIRKFSKLLPDMILPINLGPSPRILPSWKSLQPKNRADTGLIAKLISKRWRGPFKRATGPPLTDADHKTLNAANATFYGANDFRQMRQEACPPTSRANARPDWHIEQFCTECVDQYSWGQLVNNFDRSLEICDQPDLNHLHGFSLTDQRLAPIRQLVPLFGASKTDEFKDILIPLPRSRLEKPDVTWQFSRRYDQLFWRGEPGNHEVNLQALRGSQKYRLLHLLKAPESHDDVTMILPTREQAEHFRAERVPAVEAMQTLPMRISMVDSTCSGRECSVMRQIYGAEADTEEALEYRYILLTDEDDGPPSQTLRAIRSGSVPFVSTIFRTWYTERLIPWLHFVPIDVRYQGLHTTFAYYTGTQNRSQLNGRDTALQNRTEDAEWIARRGRLWAEQALARKDMEIYLFRLLLEWGRLIDDRREEIGYRRMEDGRFQNDGWTRKH